MYIYIYDIWNHHPVRPCQWFSGMTLSSVEDPRSSSASQIASRTSPISTSPSVPWRAAHRWSSLIGKKKGENFSKVEVEKRSMPWIPLPGTPEAPQLYNGWKMVSFLPVFSQLRFGVIQLKVLKWMFQVPGRCSKIVKILGLIVFCVIMQLKLHTILYLHYIYVPCNCLYF